jgi:hypothetical protein
MKTKPYLEGVMKYICLVYLEEGAYQALTQKEMDALDRNSLAYDAELQKSGHFIAAEALQPAEMATSIKFRNGKMSITDGPFVETKEHLGGFILIEAKDLDDAIRVAAKIPIAQLGGIEIRPILEVNVSE